MSRVVKASSNRLANAAIRQTIAATNASAPKSSITANNAAPMVSVPQRFMANTAKPTAFSRGDFGVQKTTPENMWNHNSVTSSIHNTLPILPTRFPSVQYVESWTPSSDGKEFVGTDYYIGSELVENYNDVARENIGRIEHSTQMSELGRAYDTQKSIVMNEVGKDQIYHRFVENTPIFKSGLVVPIVAFGKVHAILRLYSTSGPVVSNGNVDQAVNLIQNIIAAGIYGASSASSELIFTQYHKEVPLELQREVYNLIVAKGVFNPQRSYSEVDYFFKLGIAPIYFKRFGAKVIANHVQAYIASKQFSSAAANPSDMWLAIENNVKFMGGLPPEQSLHMVPYENRKIVAVERNITRRIKLIPSDRPYSLEMSVSSEPLAAVSTKKMALYVLQTGQYANPEMVGNENATDLKDIASINFLREKSPLILQRYQDLINESHDRLSPVVRVYPEYRDGTIPLMFAFRFRDHAGPTTDYMLTLTQLLQQHNLQPTRKFVETFANNMIVFSLYLSPSTTQAQISKLTKQFSLLHLVPKSEILTPKFLEGQLSAEEYTYFSAAARILFYVISQRPDEYNTLSKLFKDDMLNLGRLRSLYTNLRREAVSHPRIMRTMLHYPSLLTKVYQDFEARATTSQSGPWRNSDLEAEVARTVKGNMDLQIFNALLSFNRNVVKTNFYRATKAAISFRLTPQFFQDMDLPALPYGVFFVMGADFQGFHVRFADVSRGGIRLIRSRDDAAYSKNVATQFQETYNLAFTQNLKNKDIPEFGSKGTVLLNPESQREDIISFKRYVSALIDLLVLNEGVTDPEETIVDNYGKEELLFLGPDEGTAGVMEWAALYAKKKGYAYWRAFTTGKPASLGGIPHDTFGMTTTSVHRYVVGCIQKLGLKEEEVTKVQTGGPDGDLGSNEILVSKDKTIAVIDGSGVAYDPNGLNREELIRLAKNRVMVSNFNRSLLSPEGFFVDVNDTNITLPNGDKVESGVSFRNDFHLHPLATADLFVPCGGRPESINLSNVNNLFDPKTGKPKFRIIVEGANLFISQDARMVLEEAGVVLYKDASTNKGGVTSSSLEVLAALSVDDANFAQHMAVKDGKVPEFYLSYVAEIKDRITADAGHEFECIWREHLRTGTPRFLLTDRVSNKINSLNNAIHDSSLWDNVALRRVVLAEALPKRLQELIGLDNLLKNCPESYLHAVFSSYLGSRFVYRYGCDASEFAFYEFMSEYSTKALKNEI